MKIHILTLFPGAFESFLTHSIMKRAIAKKRVSILIHNLRDYARDRHKTCDDRPFGGGPGMLMKPGPIFEAMQKIFGRRRPRFVYPSPQGGRFDQKMAEDLARLKEMVILCGHYEGVDQRVIDAFVTDEISIGDMVLTGGELPAMVIVDAVTRLIKGVIGNEASKEFESFSHNLLEYPQYTRPADYRGRKVPSVLLSGNHKAIEDWKESQALLKTRRRRPDLLRKAKHASHD